MSARASVNRPSYQSVDGVQLVGGFGRHQAARLVGALQHRQPGRAVAARQEQQPPQHPQQARRRARVVLIQPQSEPGIVELRIQGQCAFERLLDGASLAGRRQRIAAESTPLGARAVGGTQVEPEAGVTRIGHGRAAGRLDRAGHRAFEGRIMLAVAGVELQPPPEGERGEELAGGIGSRGARGEPLPLGFGESASRATSYTAARRSPPVRVPGGGDWAATVARRPSRQATTGAARVTARSSAGAVSRRDVRAPA